MKKIKITTPENIEVEYNLAGAGSRTAAAIIDTLIQLLFIVILAAALYLIGTYSANFWEKYYGWIIGIAIIIFALISYGYFILMELSSNGQTLGKKALKIRAIKSNGQPIAIKESAIRNLFRVFIDVFGIGVVFIFFSKEYKRLGDYAASTIVVAEESKKVPITLENLMRKNEYYDYYLSKEEQDVLRDYYNRKSKMEDYSNIREELKTHFTKKFEELKILSEFQDFINEL